MFNSICETCIGAVWSIEGVLAFLRTSARIHATDFPVLLHRWEKFDLLSTPLVALHGFQVIKRYGFHRTPRTFGKFPSQLFTHIRQCSVDTDLIDGNDCAKKHLCSFVVTTEMYRQFSFCSSYLLFQKHWIHEKTGCPLSLKLIIMISATRFHAPFGLCV